MNRKNNNNNKNYPFEFLLKINGNIICQRGFYVNNYNPNVTSSLELKELTDRITGMHNGESGFLGIIPKHLKKQSENFMWNRYFPLHYQTKEQLRNNRLKTIRQDIFTFEILRKNRIIAKSLFPNKFMLYSAENQVDITNIVSEIIEEIEDFFTMDDYTHNYLESDLTFISPIWKYGETLRV